MLDPIDYITTIVILAFSASYYHITYLSLDWVRYELNEFYWIIKSPLFYLFGIFVIAFVNRNGSNVTISGQVMIFYFLCMMIIASLGNDVRYLMLGVSTVFFLSEYWEIPIYFWRMKQGDIISGGTLAMTYTLGRIMIKLCTIFYVFRELKIFGANIEKFKNELLLFSGVYFFIVSIWFMLMNSSRMNWFFRLSCFAWVVRYIYKEDIIIITR